MEHILVNRRNEFEIFLLIFLIVSVIANFITGAKPGTADALMPGWWWTVWLVGVGVGACVSLYGILCKDVVKGIFLEHSAIPLVVVGICAYVGAEVVYGTKSVILGACILLGIAGSFWARRRKLGKIIRALPKKE